MRVTLFFYYANSPTKTHLIIRLVAAGVNPCEDRSNNPVRGHTK